LLSDVEKALLEKFERSYKHLIAWLKQDYQNTNLLTSAHPEMGVFNDVIASEARQSPAARANAG